MQPVTEVETCLCQTPGHISAPCAYVSVSVKERGRSMMTTMTYVKKKPNPWWNWGHSVLFPLWPTMMHQSPGCTDKVVSLPLITRTPLLPQVITVGLRIRIREFIILICLKMSAHSLKANCWKLYVLQLDHKCLFCC